MNRQLCSLLSAFIAWTAGVLIFSTFFTPPAHAQNDKTDKTSRKLIYKVDPDYPWDLKRAHIGGMVRMDVLVSARGSVDNISVIGGNPVLVETAVRAVKKWKYAPADGQTVVQINVNFDPSH